MTTGAVFAWFVVELDVISLVYENSVSKDQSSLTNEEGFVAFDREKDRSESRDIPMRGQ